MEYFRVIFFLVMMACPLTLSHADDTRPTGALNAQKDIQKLIDDARGQINQLRQDKPDPQKHPNVKAKKDAWDKAKENTKTAQEAVDKDDKKDPAKTKQLQDALEAAKKAEAAAKKAYEDEKEAKIDELEDYIQKLKGDQAANDPSQHGGGGGGQEQGKQQPQQPPQPQQQQKDDGGGNEPSNEPSDVAKPEEPKPVELPKEEEPQIVDLGKEEEEEIAEVPPIQVPDIGLPVTNEQLPVEQTAAIDIPVQPQAGATSVPARNSLTVDENSSPGGDLAANTGQGLFNLGSGKQGESGEVYASGSGDLEDEEGYRGITNHTEGGGGGGGEGGGAEGDGDGGGFDMNNMMMGLSGGTLDYGGGGGLEGGTLVSGAAAGPNGTSSAVAEVIVSRAMAAFLEMNNRKICSTRKYRNRIPNARAPQKLTKIHIPAGYHERVGKKLEWKDKQKSAKKAVKASQAQPKVMLNSGRPR